jgi:hypothetical protein
MQLFNLGAWALAAKIYVAVGGSYITYTYRSWALSKGPLEDKSASAYRRHLLKTNPSQAKAFVGLHAAAVICLGILLYSNYARSHAIATARSQALAHCTQQQPCPMAHVRGLNSTIAGPTSAVPGSITSGR